MNALSRLDPLLGGILAWKTEIPGNAGAKKKRAGSVSGLPTRRKHLFLEAALRQKLGFEHFQLALEQIVRLMQPAEAMDTARAWSRKYRQRESR